MTFRSRQARNCGNGLERHDPRKALNQRLAPQTDVGADVDGHVPTGDVVERPLQLGILVQPARVAQVCGHVGFAVGQEDAGNLLHKIVLVVAAARYRLAAETSRRPSSAPKGIVYLPRELGSASKSKNFTYLYLDVIGAPHAPKLGHEPAITTRFR